MDVMAHRARALCVGAVVLALAACAVTRPPPPAFADYATDVQIARLLAGGCDTVDVDQAAMGAGARDLGVVLRDAGFTPDDIAAFPNTLDVSAIEARTQAFMVQNGVDLRDPATVCRAARTEMNRGTAVGGFLTAA